MRRVLVCQGLFCSAQDSHRVLSELAAALRGQDAVRVEPYYCFNGCGHGPNVVLHPDHVWYEGVKLDDVPAIAAHVATGEPVGRACGQRVPSAVKLASLEIVDRQYGS